MVFTLPERVVDAVDHILTEHKDEIYRHGTHWEWQGEHVFRFARPKDLPASFTYMFVPFDANHHVVDNDDCFVLRVVIDSVKFNDFYPVNRDLFDAPF